MLRLELIPVSALVGAVIGLAEGFGLVPPSS